MSAVWLLSAAFRLLLAACLALPAWATRDCCCSRLSPQASGKSCCAAAAPQSPLPPCCAKRLAEQRKASGPHQVAAHHRCSCEKHSAAATPSVPPRAPAAAPSTDAELLAAAPLLWLAMPAENDAATFRPGVPSEPDAAPWGAALCLTCCRWNV